MAVLRATYLSRLISWPAGVMIRRPHLFPLRDPLWGGGGGQRALNLGHNPTHMATFMESIVWSDTASDHGRPRKKVVGFSSPEIILRPASERPCPSGGVQMRRTT
jgi:hypothetical protein